MFDRKHTHDTNVVTRRHPRAFASLLIACVLLGGYKHRIGRTGRIGRLYTAPGGKLLYADQNIALLCIVLSLYEAKK